MPDSARARIFGWYYGFVKASLLFSFARYRKIYIGLALFVSGLILMLPLSGFLHTVIPHQHTHAHAEHIELFSLLHAAFERKSHALPVETLTHTFVSLLTLLALIVSLWAVVGSRYRVRAYPIRTESELHRGTLAYRRFT